MGYEEMGQIFDYSDGEKVINGIMDLPPDEAIQQLTDALQAAWRPQIEAVATRIIDDLNSDNYIGLEGPNDRMWRIIRNVHNLINSKLTTV